MTIPHTTLPCTTRIDEPDERTEQLTRLLEDPDISLRDIMGHIISGADLHNECGRYETADGVVWTDLTALSMAVLIDAEGYQLLLTPLMLNFGGDINQVDSNGRTLLAFAAQGPVYDYLKAEGAPQGAAFIGPLLDIEGIGHPGDGVVDEPLIPESEWPSLVPLWLKGEMDDFGYFNRARAMQWPRYKGGHPLIARFPSARLLANAVRLRDPERIARLIELGGHLIEPDHSHVARRHGQSDLFQDVSTVGLAVLVDSEHGGDDGFGGPAGEPRAMPAFVHVVDFHGPHDADGNTLLHLAKGSRIAEWLLRFGLPIDVKNDKGQTPLDVAQPGVRSVFEQWAFEHAMPDVAHCIGSDSGRRRL